MKNISWSRLKNFDSFIVCIKNTWSLHTCAPSCELPPKRVAWAKPRKDQPSAACGL